MKKFLIVSCIILSFFGILISTAPFILKITGLDGPAKRLLLENILIDSGNQFDLKKINIGLGKFEISEVSFASSDERLEIYIDEIILEFNIIEFVKSPGNLRKALREIYFSRPRLIIYQNLVIQNTPKRNDNISLQSLITELNAYKNLGIEDGQIIYVDKSGDERILAQKLKGWLSHSDDNNFSLNLKGSSFASSSDNFKLTGDVEIEKRSFSSNIEILNYNFDDPALELIFPSIELDGLANGALSINGNYNKLDSLNINGKIEISDLTLAYQGDQISDINLIADIKDNRISIDNGFFKYRENLVTLNAMSPNFYNSEFSGKINSVNFQVAALENFLPTDIFNGSTINYLLDFKIDSANYFINAGIESNNFSLYKSQFEKFETSLKISNKDVRIESIKASNDKLSLSGFGGFSNNSNEWNIHFDGVYVSGEHVLFDRLSNAEHNMKVGLSYNTKTKKSTGNWKYLLAGNGMLLETEGILTGDSSAVKAKMAASNFPTLYYELKVSDYFSTDPNIDFLNVKDFPFQIFSTEKIFSTINEKINTNVLLSGTINNLNSTLEVFNNASDDSIMIINASVKEILKENKKISGNIEFTNMKGSFGANFNSTLLASHFFFDDGIYGEFIVDLSKENEEIAGEVFIEKLKILKAFSGTSFENDIRYQGEISGKLGLSGSLKSPQIQGDIHGDRFVINDVGYFQPEFSFMLDNTSLSLDLIKISHNNSLVLNGNLDWAFLTDQIDGVVSGDSLDVETFLNAFNYKKDLIYGVANYKASLKGSLNQPYIDAELNLVDGKLDGIKYDKLELKLIDNLFENGSITNFDEHNLIVEKFHISRQGHYHLNTIGSLPLNSDRDMDLIVKFDGDLFSLIPHWEPFFLEGASLVDIVLKIQGNREDPRLLAADISIDRGELWLKSVAEHIENIKGKIRLEEGSNKIDMNLTAYVDEDFIKINTVRDITTVKGRKLEHWLFKGLDLDFGILSMQTSSNGVALHIPGIMLSSELGKISLSGKDDSETFYFAGPAKHPVGYGLVTLNDANITYPFILNNSPGDKQSIAVQFLSNMDWDANLKAGEDVLYSRQIPAYFDNVFTEISVDEKSLGIEFKGIINKGTFKPVGNLVSTRGRLEYLDLSFKVDRFTLDFAQNKDLPDVSGRAWTTIRDSVGAVPKTIYMQLYAIDDETGQEKQFGNWEEFKFKLISADPTIGETQEQVLAYLGYSVENIKDKATNVGSALTDKYLIRPFLRPVERILEKGLGVDFVRFNSKIAKNLFYSSIGKSEQTQNGNPFVNPFSSEIPYLYLMSSSEVTVGKYLNENIYLTYTGQLVSVYEETETGYDMNHSLGLEYRFYKNILLEFEWDRELLKYYNYENQRQYLDDFKIRFRHSFSF